VVDGWPVGDEVDCQDGTCDELIRVAKSALQRRDSGHAAITRATLHQKTYWVNPEGQKILTTTSGGCCRIALFELADGTRAAIGVGRPGVSSPSDKPMAFDYGPAPRQ
jgi:hypothetical protein